MRAILVAERGPATGSSWSVRPGQAVGIGRGPAATITLPDPQLLPRHVMVALGPDGLFATDQGGPGGTRLNGRPLAPQRAARLEPGDELELGGTLLRVEGEDLPGRDAKTQRLEPLREEPLLPPEQFEVLRELGRGAMGRVLEVRRLADGRRLAAKALFERVDPGSEGFQRFELEARVLARVQSPHVVASAGTKLLEDGRVVLLMELVEGPSLHAVLAGRGALPVPDALRVAQDVAEALAAIHAVNVVHRDVKPSNVLLDRRGVAKLTDFGIAKDLAGARGPTRSGQGLGTLSYLAPEQMFDAKRAGPRADLHGLAATLYHCLTGAPPFVGRTAEDVMRLVAFQPAPPVARKRPDTPPEVAALVDGLLAKDPELRRTTAREAADALRAARLRHFPDHRVEVFG